ncbi:MAG: NUDIX hydrolase [Nanohaloarchaea archaeon]|nr:NUDIX hydrolase [Candidatus Nanohaloarchaea archaeon]
MASSTPLVCNGKEPYCRENVEEILDLNFIQTEERWEPRYLEGTEEVEKNIEEYRNNVVEQDPTKHDGKLPFIKHIERYSGHMDVYLGETTFSEYMHAVQSPTVVGRTVTSDNKLLMGVRGEDVSSEHGKIAFPGGFIDMYEEPLEAVKREVEEEISPEIDIESTELLGFVYPDVNQTDGSLVDDPQPPVFMYDVFIDRDMQEVRQAYTGDEFEELEFIEPAEPVESGKFSPNSRRTLKAGRCGIATQPQEPLEASRNGLRSGLKAVGNYLVP